jgi:hypothetical protein
MMTKTKNRLLPIALLSLLLMSAVPAAYASTLSVTINPSTKVADLKSSSTTSIILTYPAGSSLSKQLNGYNSSLSLSGSFSGTSDPVHMLQGNFQERDNHEGFHDNVSIQNMTVTYSLNGKGNATALVLKKETDISATVSGIFTVVNGTVHIGLGWRAFSIPGAMTLNLENHDIDVNLVGSAISEQLSDRPALGNLFLGMFGNYGLWHNPTLNYSALNAPLSTWTKNYDSVTNTTTFSKTITGNSNLHVSADYNGQNYSLSVISDPSATIATEGYANVSGDSLVIQPAPLLSSPIVWVAGAVLVVAAIAGVAYGLMRSRARPSSQTTLASTPNTTP